MKKSEHTKKAKALALKQKQKVVRSGKLSIFRFLLTLRWSLFAVCVGLLVGAYSSAFNILLNHATTLFQSNERLLFLLPLGGLFIVLCYRKSGIKKDKGTNLVIHSINTQEKLPARMALLIFFATIITHLFGGSAGREAAALQMGGSIGNKIGQLLKMKTRERKMFIMCGMSAAFSAVFGTPMASAVFAMEVLSVGIMNYSALVPCMISSIIASQFALNLGIMPESFHINMIPIFTTATALKISLLALLCGVLSIVIYSTIHSISKFFQHVIKSPYLRVFIGGLLIISLTLICDTRIYNGAGTEIIEKALNGTVEANAFWLKLLFTALTLGVGFKGGEILPTFCIGSAFGCLFGHIFGISPSLCAAVAMTATFCGVTNCPISALFISFELFGFSGVLYFMIAISLSYMLSGYHGLYGTQIILYSKYKPQFLHTENKE